MMDKWNIFLKIEHTAYFRACEINRCINIIYIFSLEKKDRIKYTTIYDIMCTAYNGKDNFTMKNLRKIILVLILAAFALAMASCEKDEHAAPSGWMNASDNKADFYFYVPDDWNVDYTTAAAGAFYSEADPSSVSVLAWELEYTDTTVDEWWELNRDEVNYVFSDVTVVSEENTTVDDIYAKTYVYTANLSDFSYKIMQTAFIKDATVYLFTYTSTPENYDTHLEDVYQMLDFLTLK